MTTRMMKTAIGAYQISKPRGERASVYRPSGMLVGRYNTLQLARLAAWADCAALRGERR
jgi:hypothetical protein